MKRTIRTVVLIVVGVALAVGLIGWLAGWRTVDQFSQALTLAGLLAFAAGALSVMAGTKLAASPMYHYLQSAGPTPPHERTKHFWQDLDDRWRFLLLMAGVGAGLIGIGQLMLAIVE